MSSLSENGGEWGEYSVKQCDINDRGKELKGFLP